MSRRRRAGSVSHGSGGRSRSGESYRVGYRKPPKEHQFRPGQSGNRRGRPKGSRNTATLLRNILDRQIEVRAGSRVRKISVREAILTRFAEAALKGDTRSAAFLFQRYDDMPETTQEHANKGATVDEREIIDAFLNTLKQSGVEK